MTGGKGGWGEVGEDRGQKVMEGDLTRGGGGHTMQYTDGVF